MLDSSLSIRYRFGTSSNNAEQSGRRSPETGPETASAFREMLSRIRLSGAGVRRVPAEASALPPEPEAATSPVTSLAAEPEPGSAPSGLARLFGERPAAPEAREERTAQTPEKPAAAIEPRFLEPDNTRFNALDYASQETAQALAERFGGSVAYHQYGWMTGASMTPGIPDVLAPPPFAILDFGNTQVNAGLIASYYRPGRFSNPDAMAAQALYRAGVRNAFVDQHLPADQRNLPMGHVTNPVTGQEVKLSA